MTNTEDAFWSLKEINLSKWPVYVNPETGVENPLKFYSQIVTPKANLYLFLDTNPVAQIPQVFNPENPKTAVYNATTKQWSKWVTLKTMETIRPEWLPFHHEQQVTPSTATAETPTWLHDYNETPADYPNFVLQIPYIVNNIGGEGEAFLYLFSNNQGEIAIMTRVAWQHYWDTLQYGQVDVKAEGLKIGGYPSYTVNQKQFYWPFYPDDNNFITSKAEWKNPQTYKPQTASIGSIFPWDNPMVKSCVNALNLAAKPSTQPNRRIQNHPTQ